MFSVYLFNHMKKCHTTVLHRFVLILGICCGFKLNILVYISKCYVWLREQPAGQEKLQLPHVVTPPVFSQSQLSAPRVVLKEGPRLFWMCSDHVEARTSLRSGLELYNLSPALHGAPEESFPPRLWRLSSANSRPGVVRDVRGRSDHQEPGYPGRQAGRHTRCCSHAPGLLHDSRRDSVQHHARR